MTTLRFIGCTIAALCVAGCQRPANPPAADSAAAVLPEGHVPIGRAVPLEPEAQALIDSANAAYADKRYPDALALYRRTLDKAPGHPAPWFGISMTANMLQDSALADSARRMLEQRGVKNAPHPTGSPPPASPHASFPRPGA